MRGKPKAITAIVNETGGLVAASYKARVHRTKIGTSVRHTRHLSDARTDSPYTHFLRTEITGAIGQQRHGAVRAAVRDLHREPGLTSAERGIVRNRPIQSRHLDQAGDQPDRLPQWQAEQHLQRQAGLDRALGEGLWTTSPPRLRSMPGHRRIEPDRE